VEITVEALASRPPIKKYQRKRKEGKGGRALRFPVWLT
jgi:hypothetical protein